MSKRVSNIATSGVLNELSRCQKSTMTDTHNSYIFAFPILVKEAFDPSSIRTISSGRHTRHFLHHALLHLTQSISSSYISPHWIISFSIAVDPFSSDRGRDGACLAIRTIRHWLNAVSTPWIQTWIVTYIICISKFKTMKCDI